MDSTLVQDHFFNPRNVGELGDGAFTGRSGSVRCGATARISIIVDESQRIKDVKFKAAGCSLMVAAASLLTESVKGKSTAEAAALTRSPFQFSEALNGSRCGEPVAEALLSAITQYSDSIRHEWNGDEALICTCFCVSEGTIEAEIRKGNIKTVIEVSRACRAGAGCRSCWPLIEDILASEKIHDLSG